jgi:hypothetical protein
VAVAKYMNDFVCIKVDREERPDVDQFTWLQLTQLEVVDAIECFTPASSLLWGNLKNCRNAPLFCEWA